MKPQLTKAIVRKWLKAQPADALYGGKSYDCPLSVCLTETTGKRTIVGFLHYWYADDADVQEYALSRGASNFAGRVTNAVRETGNLLTRDQVGDLLERVWK